MNKVSMAKRVAAWLSKVPKEIREQNFDINDLIETDITYDNKNKLMSRKAAEVVSLGKAVLVRSNGGYQYIYGVLSTEMLQVHPGDPFDSNGNRKTRSERYKLSEHYKPLAADLKKARSFTEVYPEYQGKTTLTYFDIRRARQRRAAGKKSNQIII